MNYLGARSVAAMAAVAALSCGQGHAFADEPAKPSDSCTTVDRANVVPCALAASQMLRAQEHAVDAARGRDVSTTPLFPSNPTLSLIGGRRATATEYIPNWTVSVGQEIEIGGQRSMRREAARSEVSAEQSRLVVTARDIAANALRRYYDVVAFRQALGLATLVEANARGAATAARGRAEKGLAPTIEADVADATAVHALQVRLDVQQRLAEATSELAVLVGRAPGGALVTTGDLVPLAAAAMTATPAADRPEVAELDAQRRALEHRAELFRRSRVPNLTISAFVQNDNVNERIVGFGLSLPIPLPQPFGRTYAGQIAENEALAARAGSEKTQALREIELRSAVAASAFETSRTKVSAFTPELLASAERQLQNLAEEIAAGRLGIRDAMLTQQALTALLQSRIEAEHDLCLASVDLARAAGIPLEHQR